MDKRREQIEQLPEIDSLDKNGYSPLFLTCWKGYKGKIANEEREEVFENRLICARVLIEEGADVNFTTKRLKMTPLHWAAYHGDPKLVKLLIDRNAESTRSA